MGKKRAQEAPRQSPPSRLRTVMRRLAGRMRNRNARGVVTTPSVARTHKKREIKKETHIMGFYLLPYAK